jgi:hypothetical protein
MAEGYMNEMFHNVGEVEYSMQPEGGYAEV